MRVLRMTSAIALLAMSNPAASQLRSLDVPSDKGWQHARTGLILMGTLGDFRRVDLKDNGTSELDVSATYRTADSKSEASIYLYRPGLADLPLWFERSQTAMLLNRRIQTGSTAYGVVRFAGPGSTVPSGLRIVYPLAGRQTGATGLAMLPLGDWLVAVRLTSETMAPAALDSALDTVIGKIRWPRNIPPAKVANPVQPCSSRLKYKRAKQVKPNLSDALMASVLGMVVQQSREKGTSRARDTADYCLEENAGAAFSAYRQAESRSHYVLALGDAGVTAFVGPQISLDGDKGRYAVTLTDWDSSASYPAFTSMPSPRQVLEMLQHDAPVTSAGREGKNITVSSSAK